ncbi:MAG: acyl-CoA carboxylase subunit beta [Planctomycetes bacterium]|nr:acyl-CoA carboxylase subunit beta [Planctomycetota bacterium]
MKQRHIAKQVEIPRDKIASHVSVSRRESPEWQANVKAMKERLAAIATQEADLKAAGGKKAVEKKHEAGLLTARERVEALIDKGSPFTELSLFAGYKMYDEWGVKSANVITGTGYVAGRQFMIISNDSTIKAGAYVPMTAKKILRAQRIAMENRLPLIYLVDSAGVFLPMQEEIFPDKDDFGKIFDYNSRISAAGIPQISAVMGLCVAGGAYMPVIVDHLIMTKGSGLYLAAAALAKAAKMAGPDVTNDEIGGAEVHAGVSGTSDWSAENDQDAIRIIRDIASRMGPRPKAIFDRAEKIEEPAHPADELYGLIPANPYQGYEMREVIARIVDGSIFNEYKASYGKTIVCGYARIGGYSVGIVANQKETIKHKDKPWETGGVIYPDSATKAARFIMDCNQLRIPLVFLHDVNGFVVGPEAEHAGIIRHGAKMVNAMSNSVVPKFSIIVGGSFGAGHYAMCGRAYRPRLIAAWPSARYAVMGGDAAANTLLSLKVGQLKAQGKELSDADQKALLKEIKDHYTESMAPEYGAARLWLDAVIDPAHTRAFLIEGLRVAEHNDQIEEFKTGVFQV